MAVGMYETREGDTGRSHDRRIAHPQAPMPTVMTSRSADGSDYNGQVSNEIDFKRDIGGRSNVKGCSANVSCWPGRDLTVTGPPTAPLSRRPPAASRYLVESTGNRVRVLSDTDVDPHRSSVPRTDSTAASAAFNGTAGTNLFVPDTGQQQETQGHRLDRRFVAGKNKAARGKIS